MTFNKGPATGEVLDVSIVIPSFDRTALLGRTLRACLSQSVPDRVRMEIVVADNHPDLLAAPIVAALADGGVVIRHVAAGQRNIARARNIGVAAATGALIAFVDDDEAPEPGWLAAHIACLRRTGADASFGPKRAVFEGGVAPTFDPAGRFYTTDFGLAADSGIRPLAWWPSPSRGLGTGNSVLRRATCLPGPAPFDETLGRCGGEDSLLLLGLARRGRRFVWCPDACVLEFNEKGRQSFGYMRRRLLRSGQHSAMARSAASRTPRLTRLIVGLAGGAQALIHGLGWLVTRHPHHALKVAKGLGKIGLGSLDFLAEGDQSARSRRASASMR